ncbi:sulfatase [Halorubrum sp. CGM4_25_10-8A]|uniref:sulfatase n=1 Tax=Halorubrum sp. CGM4_25_10-8A TaxID=2518116 RepID=UPI0010FA502B|nr:sulfatase [Halorubrum sp. CGM4_25_10-8A]TKX41339.1 sulfatase [Halorubrum sp. CGM4_25_10-8A]
MTDPNILCVSVDSVRADFCNINGENGENTTPFLNSIASEATVFRNAITPSTWTLPVHASVFTGLYPPEHGILTGNETLGDHPTFAQCLSKNGYSTDAFFKNGWLETGDILRGFDHSDGTDESKSDSGIKTQMKRRIADELENFPELAEQTAQILYHAQKQYREWSGLGSVSSRGGERTIREYVNHLSEGNEPFCSFVHFNDAHWRYNPPNPYQNAFSERTSLGNVYNYAWWQYQVYASRTNRLKAAVGDTSPPDREVETFKNLYRSSIRHTDSLVEELIDSLKRQGVWDDTILILFGDHGDSFGEDGIFGHHFSVHDSIIHVPFMIRDPTGQLDTGTVSDPVSLVDIYPTVLELAGVSGPETSGINLLRDSRDIAYSYYDVSDHDLYLGASDRGIDPDRLPPAKQYVAWAAEGRKVIEYPEEDEYVIVGHGDSTLRARLEEHRDQLDTIDTKEGCITDDVAKRLEGMGYLRE